MERGSGKSTHFSLIFLFYYIISFLILLSTEKHNFEYPIEFSSISIVSIFYKIHGVGFPFCNIFFLHSDSLSLYRIFNYQQSFYPTSDISSSKIQIHVVFDNELWISFLNRSRTGFLMEYSCGLAIYLERISFQLSQLSESYYLLFHFYFGNRL